MSDYQLGWLLAEHGATYAVFLVLCDCPDALRGWMDYCDIKAGGPL